MQINIINQWPNGGQNLLKFLREVVNDKSLGLINGRFLVAYLSAQGLQMMESILATLQKRKGTISAIIGYDPHYTNENSLKKAIELFGKGFLKIMGAANCTFHPKVYLLDGERYMVVIIGSQNLTEGGLFNNWETSVLLLLDRSEDEIIINEIENLWKSFASYEGPLQEKLDASWLSKHKNLFEDIQTMLSPLKKRFPHPFGRAALSRHVIIKPKKEMLPKLGSSAPTSLLPTALLMEVLRETGTGGTQVQLPVDVLQKYFGIDKGTRVPITIRLNGNDYRANILHFPNHTHRIQMTFLENYSRPLIIKLKRVPRNRDLYNAEIFLKSSRQYKKLLKKCNMQTRNGSKRYGFM